MMGLNEEYTEEKLKKKKRKTSNRFELDISNIPGAVFCKYATF